MPAGSTGMVDLVLPPKSLPHEAGEGGRRSRPDGVWAVAALPDIVAPAASALRFFGQGAGCPPHPIRLPPAGTWSVLALIDVVVVRAVRLAHDRQADHRWKDRWHLSLSG